MSGIRKLLVATAAVMAVVAAISTSAISLTSPASADGDGSPAGCLDTTPGVVGSISGDPVATYDAGSGNIVSGVCIKSGANMFGGNQHSGVLGNGTYEDGCYRVEGVGTQVVTVTRLQSGSDCQDISHIDAVVQP